MTKPRARDLGIPFAGTPGSLNAITDVNGVTVGHQTLVSGEGNLLIGQGPVRTGVTAVLPRGQDRTPVFAAWHTLNGCGEMTGTTWIEESGLLDGPVMLTNTFSVGVVRDAISVIPDTQPPAVFGLPVVAETYDGLLNDIKGMHVKPEHAWQAYHQAKGGPVAEGNVGGGTGMVCHRFKGGIGTASRKLKEEAGGYTVGVLVQANHGSRSNLAIAGVPVGQFLNEDMPLVISRDPLGISSSIIVVLATDAPLLPHQLKRLARRVTIGIGIVGGMGENYSGDIFIAFSTANPEAMTDGEVVAVEMLSNARMNPLFDATARATEEAIVNALVAAETMSGINGNTVYALPHQRLCDLLRAHNRLVAGSFSG